MTENCNHKWEPISSDMNAEEWVSGLGDNPMICRECGVVRRGDILQEIEELEAKLENLNGMGTVGYMLGYKKGGDGNKVLIDYIKRLEAAFLEQFVQGIQAPREMAELMAREALERIKEGGKDEQL